MIRFKLNKERKILFASAMAALLIGLGYRFFPSGSESSDVKEEIILKSRKVVEYREKAASLSSIEKMLEDSRRQLEKAEGILLNGDTEALAAVDVQNIINEIAYRSKVEIKNTRVLNSEKQDNQKYLGIRVEVRLSATTRQLKEMLYRIACSNKLLAVKDLNVNAPNATNPLDLDVDLVVSGVMKIVDS